MYCSVLTCSREFGFQHCIGYRYHYLSTTIKARVAWYVIYHFVWEYCYFDFCCGQ